MQNLFKLQKPQGFRLRDLTYRNFCPYRNDICHIIFGYMQMFLFFLTQLFFSLFYFFLILVDFFLEALRMLYIAIRKCFFKRFLQPLLCFFCTIGRLVSRKYS